MPSTASTTYQDFIEGKLIAAIAAGTTTGILVKIKQVNGATPTWPTAAHRIKIVQKTATNNKVEKLGIAAGTSQSGQTVTLGTATRALSLSDGTTFSGGTGVAFAAGADVFITWDNQDAAMTVKKDIDSTITGNVTFSGDIVTSDSFKVPVYADATARDAAIVSPANGMIVYLTDPGVMYQYIGGAWTTFATGSVSNMANGTAGKGDVATAAEIAAGTANDASSGAANVLTVGVTAITGAGAGDTGKIPALNTSGVLNVSVGGTGAATHTANAVLIGEGTSPITSVAPGTAKNVLKSDGTDWVSGSVPVYSKVVYCSGAAASLVGASTTDTVYVATHVYTVPANDLVEGVAYDFEWGGTIAWAAGTLTLTPSLATSGPALDLVTPGGAGDFRVIGTLYGTAAAGSSVAVKFGAIGIKLNAQTQWVEYSTHNLATDGTLLLQLGVTFSSSNGGNGVTAQYCKITKHSSTLF